MACVRAGCPFIVLGQASQANTTGTRRGDSITDVIMTLFLRRVSPGQKRQPNNTVGAAAVHPDDELPTERRTHEKK